MDGGLLTPAAQRDGRAEHRWIRRVKGSSLLRWCVSTGCGCFPSAAQDVELSEPLLSSPLPLMLQLISFPKLCKYLWSALPASWSFLTACGCCWYRAAFRRKVYASRTWLVQSFPLPEDMHRLFSATQHAHTGPTLKGTRTTITVNHGDIIIGSYNSVSPKNACVCHAGLRISAQGAELAEPSAQQRRHLLADSASSL